MESEEGRADFRTFPEKSLVLPKELLFTEDGGVFFLKITWHHVKAFFSGVRISLDHTINNQLSLTESEGTVPTRSLTTSNDSHDKASNCHIADPETRDQKPN